MVFIKILIIIVYLLCNFLIGRKILKLIHRYSKKPTNKLSIVYWVIFILIASSFGVYMYLGDSMPHFISKIIFNIGSYYEIALLYLVILFSISFLCLKIFKNLNNKIDLYIISLAIILVILPVATYLGTTSKVTNYELNLDKLLKEGTIKIALVSDIHLGNIIGNKRLDKLISELNTLDSDLVVISGDLIDSDLEPVVRDNMLSKLSNIKSTFGTFFAFGNHDIYTNKVEELTTFLQAENVNVLRDQYILINDSFYILGRNDVVAPRFNQDRSDLSKLLITLDKSKPLIVIDHNPNALQESAENNIDLQLSGHTHNGQLFPLNIIAKKIFALEYGLKKFDNTNVIVSSGYGTWGPTMRTASQSEIVLITLKSNQDYS